MVYLYLIFFTILGCLVVCRTSEDREREIDTLDSLV